MNKQMFAPLVVALFTYGFVAFADAQAQDRRHPADTVYVAHLQLLNSKVTGMDTTGEARFAIDGDQLTVTIKVKGAAPEVVHWQHFHGFKDNTVLACPTAAADANADGVIDAVEP